MRGFPGPAPAWVDAFGAVYLAGTYAHAPDLGGGKLPDATGDDAAKAVFVIKFDSTGKHVWSRGYGTAAGKTTWAAIDLDGSGVVVAGAFTGTVDLGSGPIRAAGSTDAFVLALGEDGSPRWSAQFGSNVAAMCGVAVTGAGDLLVGGTFTGDLDLGDGQPLRAGHDELFIARLGASTHAATWNRNLGGFSNGSGVIVRHAGSGPMFVGGSFYGSLELGPGTVASAGERDAFVSAFSP